MVYPIVKTGPQPINYHGSLSVPGTSMAVVPTVDPVDITERRLSPPSVETTFRMGYGAVERNQIGMFKFPGGTVKALFALTVWWRCRLGP